jgi:hypothetical protein
MSIVHFNINKPSSFYTEGPHNKSEDLLISPEILCAPKLVNDTGGKNEKVLEEVSYSRICSFRPKGCLVSYEHIFTEQDPSRSKQSSEITINI